MTDAPHRHLIGVPSLAGIAFESLVEVVDNSPKQIDRTRG